MAGTLVHRVRMRPPDPPKRNPAALGDGGPKTDHLGGLIVSEDSPDPQVRQANWLSRRFRLNAERAQLIAGIAFAEGAR
jgi:hypothetical protein